MRVLVLADTHLRADVRTRLPGSVVRSLGTADVVLHAGDVMTRQALGELRGELKVGAALHAVLGNNDTELVGALPERLVLDLGGVRVAMVHDSGPRRGRAARLRRWFPAADVVVFGHSHEPCDETGLDGQVLFNPGSPTQRRRQPQRTAGRLLLSDGRVASRHIEPV